LKKSALSDNQKTRTSPTSNNPRTSDLEIGYSPIEKIIGMYTYNNNAQLVGRISEVGLRKTSKGKVQFGFKITNSDNEIIEVEWDNIDKIGDIVILNEKGIDDDTQSNKEKVDINKTPGQDHKICAHCNHKNDIESLFCEECGKKME
jgi:sporulation protein YlmC with PRC-barrel domain